MLFGLRLAVFVVACLILVFLRYLVAIWNVVGHLFNLFLNNLHPSSLLKALIQHLALLLLLCIRYLLLKLLQQFSFLLVKLSHPHLLKGFKSRGLCYLLLQLCGQICVFLSVLQLYFTLYFLFLTCVLLLVLKSNFLLNLLHFL